VRRLSSAVIDMLMSYHWPGNVRELENCLERAVLVAEGDVIHPYHLPPTLQTAEPAAPPSRAASRSGGRLRARHHVDALKSTRGNMAAAARNLETTQRIFGYKVHQYAIEPEEIRGVTMRSLRRRLDAGVRPAYGSPGGGTSPDP
jgi:Nif-specific regulatory protein